MQSSKVTSLSWAPRLGRPYYTLATAGMDTKVYLWVLDINFEQKSCAVIDLIELIHNGPINKVEWNDTGSVLVTLGEQDYVRIWSKSYDGGWKSEQVFPSDDETGTL